MNALPLGLSLTSTFTKVGAIAGFAALLGIALLSLLAFAQAREIKRLREWAGRAPERAAEMEQRVSTEAAARMQRAGAPAAAGARVVPRKTPLVSAPVSTAVNATVAAGKIGAQPNPAAPALTGSAAAGPANPPATGGAQADPASGDSALPSADQADEVAAGTAQPSPPRPDASPVASSLPDAPMPGAEGVIANGVGSPQTVPAPDQQQSDAIAPHDDEQPAPAPAPATTAARAVPIPRSPLPPSPSAPAPPGVPASTVAGAAAAAPLASGADASAQATQSAVSRPPAPMASARPVASRAVSSPPTSVAAGQTQPGARKPTSPRTPVAEARGGGVSGAGAARMPGVPVGSGPKYFKQERSTGRTTLLILGGVVVGVAVIVLAVSALKGGAKASPTPAQSSTPSTVAHTTKPAAPASNPSELNVAVVNGTSTNDLAHHLAADLQQSGYTRAEASSAVPPGTHPTTVVQYTTGHRADGQAVAKALDVTRVQPMEASTASLVSHATVVVVAGADQAAQLGGGGAQSTGEPSAGASGEAGTGAGGAASGTAASGEGTGVGGATEGTAGSGQ